MKTCTAFLILLFSGLQLLSQKIGDKFLMSDPCNLYDIPSITGKATKLSMNDTVTILQLEDPKTGYYFVQFRSVKGYLNATRIVMAKKNLDPSYKKAVETSKREAKISEDIARRKSQSWQNIYNSYVSQFGKPNDLNTYSSEDYESKTLIWHCAQGRYRSIDFKLENGIWVKESEYTSDCIR